MADIANDIVDLIQAGRIEQPRILSNEMLQNFSPERLKLELGKYKKESLSILSNQLTSRVTETETPSPVSHTVTYSGYFINEEELEKIKEALGWQAPTSQEQEQETAPAAQ